MFDQLEPRWIVGSAALAGLLGIVGLWLGYVTLAPMALFVSIVLTILAAILSTTPNMPSIEEINAREQARVAPDHATAAANNEEHPRD